VVTRSYSPGTVSGVALWAPLGLLAVVRSRQLLPHPVWRRGIMAGALIRFLASHPVPGFPMTLDATGPQTITASRKRPADALT